MMLLINVYFNQCKASNITYAACYVNLIFYEEMTHLTVDVATAFSTVRPDIHFGQNKSACRKREPIKNLMHIIVIINGLLCPLNALVFN